MEKVAKTRYWGWSFILFVIIFILAFYYSSEIRQELLLLSEVNVFWLLIAVASQVMTYLFSSLAYLLLLRIGKFQHAPPGWRDLFSASFILQAFNQTMPSAGISGNSFLFTYLGRFEITTINIISVILTELLSFYAAMETVVAVLLFLCLFLTGVPHVFKVTLVAGILIFLVFGAAVILAGKKQFLSRVYAKLMSFGFARKLLEKFSRSGSGQGFELKDVQIMTFIKKGKKAVLNTFLAELLVITADGLTLYALILGLGMKLPVFTIMLCFICTKVIATLPFSPGGLILFESSMVFFFVKLGVPASIAIIITLLYRFLSFWAPIPIGFLLYRKWLMKAR